MRRSFAKASRKPTRVALPFRGTQRGDYRVTITGVVRPKSELVTLTSHRL
jgi:hypothetical protein